MLEMIKIATGKHFHENTSEKHYRNAALGWHRFDSSFTLPVYDQNSKINWYNVFYASMVVRRGENGKMHLYDVMDIKKETGNPLKL